MKRDVQSFQKRPIQLHRSFITARVLVAIAPSDNVLRKKQPFYHVTWKCFLTNVNNTSPKNFIAMNKLRKKIKAKKKK